MNKIKIIIIVNIVYNLFKLNHMTVKIILNQRNTKMIIQVSVIFLKFKFIFLFLSYGDIKDTALIWSLSTSGGVVLVAMVLIIILAGYVVRKRKQIKKKRGLLQDDTDGDVMIELEEASKFISKDSDDENNVVRLSFDSDEEEFDF